VTPYSVRCPDHRASRCRRHAADDPASGDRQQHPHQTGHQRVCEPDRDVQRDPHQADGEAVLRGLSQGRLPASGTFRWQGFVERYKRASSRRCCGAWGAPPVGRDPPWHFKLWSFGAQCTQSSATVGSSGVWSSFRPCSLLSGSAETQLYRVHRDVFHEQSPLTPTPFFSASPSKHTC